MEAISRTRIFMKHFLLRLLVITICFTSLNGIRSYAQQHTVTAKNAMTAGPRNYTYFTQPYQNEHAEVLQHNQGFEQHPELGQLFAETPCNDCYELIGSRTAYSKTFVKEGTEGRDIMQQTSSAPMHYKDAQGRWMTVHSQLMRERAGVYSALQQETPVRISMEARGVTLGAKGNGITFNNDLELVYVAPDGTERSLGVADYSHHTAGDDGVYVTDAWPGIDIEIFTLRGAVKTNFRINRAMPDEADGQLLVRDHLKMDDGLSLYAGGATHYTGNLAVNNATGARVYAISAASVYEQHDAAKTLQLLEYRINGNTLDIALPGNFLNRSASAYPVIIDPLVSTTSTTTVTGSTYSPTWTTGCSYTNAATVPAKTTVTDVQFSFQYVTSGGALLRNGAFDFRLGTCRSPTPTALFWNCNDSLTGTCTGTAASLFPSLASCVPAPSCTAYDLGLTMGFYQNYLSDAPCSNLYITAGTPLTITVFGHTIEASSVTASTTAICGGQSATLSGSAQYGVGPYSYNWSPGSLTGATVNVTPSTTTTYTLTATDACGDVSTSVKTVTVTPLSPIVGTSSMCVGAGSTFTNATAGGGVWSSSNTTVATIGAGSGSASALAAGVTTITFAASTGCNATMTVTVHPAVGTISGPTNLCIGGSSALADGTAGGTWSSSNTAVATITAGGVVTGVASGTSIIDYGISGTGCTVGTTVSVNALAPIIGNLNVCTAGTTTLSDPLAGTGGTWTSGSAGTATVGASTGVVSGVTPGTATVTYTTPSGCTANAMVTVNAPTPIAGPGAVCMGNSITLSNSVSGGTWSSSNTTIATVDATGDVAGVSASTVTISYSAPTGCVMTTPVVVNPIYPIGGSLAVCAGGVSTLSDAASGGSWTSSNASVASIGASSGIVSGGIPGTATITYTTFGGGCVAVATVTVSALAPITGASNVCQGGATTLSSTTGGGAWSSSDVTIAAVGGATGVMRGVAAGTATITYSTIACTVTMPVTVNGVAPITGALSMCAGSTSSLGDAIPGGTWSIGGTSATISGTGVVTGVTSGTAAVSYVTPAGCTVPATVTVDLSPTAITGSTLVCSTTILSESVPGGSWTSSDVTVAAVSVTTGVVTGLAPGVATISYTMPGGCYTTMVLTVNPLAPITGTPTVCQGSSTTLSYPATGGTWTSLSTAVAAVGSSGVVTGVSAGVTTIRYTTTSGCVATTGFTVYASSPITGTPTVCQGSTTSLSDAVSGGTWSSSDISVATVSAGLVTPSGAGTATITYTTAAGCVNTQQVTVNPLTPITGTPSMCVGGTAALSDATSGGSWNSVVPSVATVAAGTGVVNGIGAGTSTIEYTTAAGCVASVIATVNAMPSAIGGAPVVCQSSTTTLSNTLAGGTWASSSPSIATVVAGTGVVTGLLPGATTITYTTGAGCAVSATVTVNAWALITGIGSICDGNRTTLSNAIAGGVWSSTVPTVATVSTTGMVTGVTPGTSNIVYTTAAGCISTFTETINPLPSVIGGVTKVCVGGTTTLTNTLAGGVWSSGNVAVATVGIASGVVTGIAADTATITYTSAAGCATDIVVTVNGLPASITGTASLCAGDNATLSDATTGGVWSSGSTSVAIIGSATGMYTGIAAGTAAVNYEAPDGCNTAILVTVNPVPGAIAGAAVVCEGATTTLTNTLAGGTWSSTLPAVATIGSGTGVLAGVATGNVTISYTTSAGCFVTVIATVNTTPVISSAVSGPTTCITADGVITLSGLVSGDRYTVNYTATSGSVVTTLTASGGSVQLTGLAAGNYSGISVTTSAGCTSNAIAGPVTLVLPAAPPAPSVGSNSPICAGSELDLTANDATTGVTYNWSGPNGFTSTGRDPIFNPAPMADAGTYTVTATALGCVSGLAIVTVVIHPIPQLTSITYTDPTICMGVDGAITLTGLLPSVSYTVTYTDNTSPETATLVADSYGKVVVNGLPAGTYASFVATSYTCGSNTEGPVTLADPPPPSAPTIASNAPQCFGGTLRLYATDAVNGVLYEWSGPNGFSSGVSDPEVANITDADSGIYTLVVKYRNCPATAAIDVPVYPPVKLVNVTVDKTIPLGASIQLNADSAEFYVWAPEDGTLSNPNINDPVATPSATETYTVRGMNQWGCVDSAYVTITVDDNINEFVPSAFTPGDHGHNDVFRIGNVKYDKLVEFSVFNRWGQIIYHNTTDVTQGWDGKFNGVPQDVGVYSYVIVLATPEGTNKVLKGTVTLVR
jgi:trimeric autotransporter adhesin